MVSGLPPFGARELNLIHKISKGKGENIQQNLIMGNLVALQGAAGHSLFIGGQLVGDMANTPAEPVMKKPSKNAEEAEKPGIKNPGRIARPDGSVKREGGTY